MEVDKRLVNITICDLKFASLIFSKKPSTPQGTKNLCYTSSKTYLSKFEFSMKNMKFRITVH
jgi:hypothetical protein